MIEILLSSISVRDHRLDSSELVLLLKVFEMFPAPDLEVFYAVGAELAELVYPLVLSVAETYDAVGLRLAVFHVVGPLLIVLRSKI
jgi:hypothetical protein